MSDPNLPQGIELTPLDEQFRTDPYAILKRLREAAPVHDDQGLKQYFVTRHDDVKAILHDKAMWSDPRKANPGTFSAEFLISSGAPAAEEEPSMLLMDEPGHRRLRSLVSRPFTPAAVERWRPRTREVIARVLDAISAEQFDLIAEFAGPIPTVVIAEMLGIDAARHGDFKRWSDLSVKTAFNPFASPEETAAARAANTQLNKVFTGEIAARRQNLGEDLLSDMLRAEEAGERLTDAEIIRQCNLLLVAGNVTTTDLIGNGVKALLDNPEQLARLRANPALIKNAVEEMLRYDSPVTNSGRIANREVAFAGCPVATGETLTTSLAAANHDPAVYPDPDRFDIERADTHHQSFGGGSHLCLGAHLARLEAQEAILALLQRYPDLRHGAAGYAYAAIPSFRGLSQFWVQV